MKKNVSGQAIGAQMVSATDGSAFTGSVTVSVTGDAGTQATGSVGSGACTHEGNGYHTYAPAQAETNYDLVAFTFTGTGAIPVTVQVYTDFPQTGDSYARIGAPAGASVSADVAAVKTDTAAILLDTGTDGVVVAASSVRSAVGLASANLDTQIAALPTAAANADAVWDEARSGHTTDGTFGQVNQAVRSGTAQGGGTNTITLDASASATDDIYNGCLCWIVGSTGAGQAGVITGYVGSTKVATVDNNWRTNPDSSSVFVLLPGSLGLTSASLASAVLDATASSYNTAGTIGGAINTASSAGDPWATSLPGAYASGTAGNIIGNNLDAAVTSRLAPTTSGRTLDVTATGAAGVDWGNVENPTTVVGLSGTTVKTATDVETDTADIQGRLPAALVSGRMDASVGAYQTGLTPLQPTTAGRTLDVTATGAAGIDLGNVENPTTTLNLSGTTVAAVSGAVGSVTGAVGSVTGNVGGNVAGSVASVTADVTLSASERNSVADALLNRGLDGAGASSRLVREALALGRNKWTISGSTLTVYDVDDTTVLYTATITSASGNPVTGVDPA